MLTQRADRIIEMLETDPAEKVRERTSCKFCGSKDHVKVVHVKVRGKAGIKIKLCSECRGKNFKKKGGRKNR